jgi:hypothetical protein
MFCVFCDRQPPDVVLTEEHVFPEAIGGQLVLNCVCKTCNDQLGSYVDSQLTENFLVRMLRLGLCVPSKGGRIASPLHDGTIKDHPDRRGTFHPKGDGTGQVTLQPLVECTTGPDGRERVRVVASPLEAEEILKRIRERAARKGRDVRVLEQWQETIKKPVVSKTERSSPTNLVRAVLKIAYELGVYWLGPSYSSHVTGLPILRAVVGGVIADVEATMGYFPPDSAFGDWEIPSWYHAARLEVASTGIWTSLRVFNVIEGRVRLVDHSVDFPQVAPRWLLLDPLTGGVIEGLGPRPTAIDSTADTGISWSATGRNRFRVTVQYRGQESTSTEMELEGV